MAIHQLFSYVPIHNNYDVQLKIIGADDRLKFVDIPDPSRVAREPSRISLILENARFQEQEFGICRVELRLYLEKTDERLGDYSLITSVVYTDKGSIEMIYDEGFRGQDSLERASRFLTANLGVSGLILRSIIALREELSGT